MLPEVQSSSESENRDRVFEQPDRQLFERFEFNDEVASVFDNMVERSVPCYATIQSLLAQLALRFHDGRPIYDLGCSTGSTFEAILKRARVPLRLVGVDTSAPMLERCRNKLAPNLGLSELRLQERALEDVGALPVGEAGVVVLSLVLQFLRPTVRGHVFKGLHRALAAGGCVLLVEKTLQRDREINGHFLELYHEYKLEQGYSRVEIARKREALENRLIPFYPEENRRLLEEAGFVRHEVFFSWLNFQGYLAVKG